MLERMTSMKLEDLKLGMQVKMTDLGVFTEYLYSLQGLSQHRGMEVRA